MKPTELLVDLPDRQRSQAGHSTKTTEVHVLTRQTPDRAEASSRSPAPSAVGGHGEAVQSPTRDDSRLSHILPKHHFLKQMHREKRRVDRSKAPLSIALFHLAAEQGKESDETLGLIELLCNRKRESDVVGYIDENLIAILLPDTNQEGAQGFIDKIGGHGGNWRFSGVARTYPDQLFENLAVQGHDLPDLYPFFVDHSQDRSEFSRVLKRGIDVVGSILGILLLSPVMVLTAIAVAATSPGPVIFKQIRLGKGGIPFVFYKFRSMYSNVDDRIHREYVASLIEGNHEEINQGNETKPLFKMKADPRITRLGRIIRKTSIDELPQLFNVLKGDMSLVGPRPPLQYEVEKYQSWHLRRVLEIKPGITGLWQVEGRSKTTFDEMVRLDLRYIRTWSLMLDLKILIKTIRVVLRCDGAN